ncbi:MAG: hypothetical protein EHM37_13335 [Deltaproteobacteria bacterium]|nr:MAG: hypothetical protein EHM37_13335 [Deltaproteobacteria bacterium]
MTHSLHRCGKHQEKDYVWLLYHVKGVNDQNLKQRYQKSLEIAEAAGAVNWGDVKSGPVVTLSPEEIRTRLTDKSRLRGAFSSLTQVTKFLKDMKAEDLGVCVIIAGPLKEVLHSCRESGVEPHTINYSLGVFGKTELLADDSTLAITTMCGHHMVPDGIVEKYYRKVQKGKIKPEKAAHKLAVMCPCGIFNQERAAILLKEFAETAGSEQKQEGRK